MEGMDLALRQAYNQTIGEIGSWTTTADLEYIYDGGGWGFGIWFAARRELAKRGLLILGEDGKPDQPLWASN